MKKLVAIAVILGLTGGVMAAKKADLNAPCDSTKAGIVATVTLAEDGDKLWCHVKFTGVEKGQRISPVIKWTAPEVYYTTKKGNKVLVFDNSTYESPSVRTKTKAWRTLSSVVSGTEKTMRAVGIWKVEVLVDGVVIGSAEYKVKG